MRANPSADSPVKSTNHNANQSQPSSPSSHSRSTSSNSTDFGAFVEPETDQNQFDSLESEVQANSAQVAIGIGNGNGNGNRGADLQPARIGMGKSGSHDFDLDAPSLGSRQDQQSYREKSSAAASTGNQNIPAQGSGEGQAEEASVDDSSDWGEWGQTQNQSSFSPVDESFPVQNGNDWQSQSGQKSNLTLQSQPLPPRAAPPNHSDQSRNHLDPNSQTDWDAWLINSNPSSAVNSNRTSRANTPSRFPSNSTSNSNTIPNPIADSSSTIFTERRKEPSISNSNSTSTQTDSKNTFDDLLPPGFTLPPPPSASEIPDPPIHSFSPSLNSKGRSSYPASMDLLSDDDGSQFNFEPNQDFFSAFSRATSLSAPITQVGPPSPPIIDLRETERKLDRAREKSKELDEGNNTDKEEDFFSSFEKSPSELMKTVGRNNSFKSNPSLEGENLENLGEAQSSVLEIPIAKLSKNHPRENEGEQEDFHASTSSPSNSRNGSAGSWSGSLRKTWSSLKGSLPSASDFLVMEDGEGGEWNPGTSTSPPTFASPKQNDPSLDMNEKFQNDRSDRRRESNHSTGSNDSVRSNSVSKSPQGAKKKMETATKKPVQKLAHASDYNGGGMNNNIRRNSHAPISGAPGFAFDSTPHWNTGSWTLDDSPPARSHTFPEVSPHRSDSRSRSRIGTREIKVTLSDRREETSEVITSFHSSRIHPHLPPRLQLGKNWKLLYSMDQHGISLSTLYQKISLALDPSKARKTGSEYDASGVMLGASKEALASVGIGDAFSKSEKFNGRIRVGGGLDLKDAGLVIAVKDGEENVFGAFVNERLRPQSSYYGNGEW